MTITHVKTVYYRDRDEWEYFYRLTWSNGSTTEQDYWSADLTGVPQS